MLITHTGDVSEARAAAGTHWLLTLTDRTTTLSVIVMCKGEALIEVAKMAKVGQVFEVVGWTSRPPTTRGFAVVPFILRAKSGTNEADINLKTGAYTNALIEGKNPALEAEVESLRKTIAVLRMDNDKALTIARSDSLEITRLRDAITQLERDVQAERIMNAALEMP